MKYAIEVRDLTKKYQLFKLDNVSFTVPGGTIVGLIGENGAGKSTTLKAILNLIRRDGGAISLLERDNIKDETTVKEDIGVVLDEGAFHDTLTADMVGDILSHVYQKWDKNLYQALLKRYDLPRNLELVREASLRQAEEHLQQAVEAARAGGVTLAELTETLNILYGGD